MLNARKALLYALVALAGALLLPLSSASAAEFVWAKSTTSATRWMETTSTEVGTTTEGQRLEVLYEEGDRLRVRLKGATFGWLNAADVADADPNPAETGLPSLDGLPQLQLGADGQLQLPPNFQLGGGEGLKLELE